MVLSVRLMTRIFGGNPWLRPIIPYPTRRLFRGTLAQALRARLRSVLSLRDALADISQQHLAIDSLLRMSRRHGSTVAWHEVPGAAPPQKSRPVGYGMIRAGVCGSRHTPPSVRRVIEKSSSIRPNYFSRRSAETPARFCRSPRQGSRALARLCCFSKRVWPTQR
jgi:hypothetical protein